MRVLVGSFCLALSGCAAFSPLEVAPPGSITVEKAMQDVGSGFVALNKKLQEGDVRTGMIACSTTLTFNVAANADQGGTGKLTLMPGSAVTALSSSSSLSLEQTNKSHAERSNAVTIELVHAACIGKDKLGYEHPEKIGLVYNPPGGSGGSGDTGKAFTIFNKPTDR